MERWTITNNRSNTCYCSFCTPQKCINELSTPTSAATMSSFVRHQHSNAMAREECSNAASTCGLNTSTWSPNSLNSPLTQSNSSNIYHASSSNGGSHDLLPPPKVSAMSFSDNPVVDQLPSWFDILLMSSSHYSNNDASRQALKSIEPYLHSTNVDLDNFLGDLDKATTLQNDFEQKLSLVHDHTFANHQFLAEEAATLSYDDIHCGVNDKACSQSVNTYIDTKVSLLKASDDDQYKRTSSQSSCHYIDQHLNQRKRKIQPQENYLEKRGKLGETYTKLQNLVSPLGKKNQATTLLEAISCIKFLQDKVQTLSLPYLESCNAENGEGVHKDLKSKGLCLVPFSWTMQLTNTDGEDCMYRQLFR